MIFFSKGSKKQKLTLFWGKKRRNSVDWFTLPKLLTIKKVCELLEVHPNTLRNWDVSKKLIAVRVGTRKDRRYERDTIKKMYESLHPVAPQSPVPHTKLPAPIDGGKYVLKPGLSATKIKLLLISKKFTFFVYSATIVAFTFVVVQMFFFAHVFVIQAEVAQVTPKMLRLAPSSATGWENPNNAQQLDVISSGEINQFTPKNSATYMNRPVVVKGEETTVPSLAQMPTEEPSLVPPTNAPLTNSAPFTNTAATNSAAALGTTNPDLELSGFAVPGEISLDSIVNDATLGISFGGQTYQNNEDVITFSYSMDGGASWQPLDSFALTATVSNATHGGYWEYPLTDKIASLQNLDSFRIKINYNAVPGPQEATAYVDGIILNLTITEPPSESTVQQLDQSVTLDKQDFTADEAPTLNVEVEKKSKLAFLGAKPITREVKSMTITSPTGETTEVDAVGTTTTEKSTTTTKYQINPRDLSVPGAYTITTTIEQNGYIREVTETFVWGALAINTDKSLYQKGDTAHFSIGAVDDNGQTVCNANITLTIIDPSGAKNVLSTANGGITVTDYCHQKELYQGPDYTGDFIINNSGDYTVDLRATVNGNERTLTDAFAAEDEPEFMLQRDGPTRVFPVIEQPMTLTVTVAHDFQGIIREFVPANYTVKPENGGTEQPYDLGGSIARTIVWDVDLKAGSTVTLKYLFKAPEKSPALFFLGPARVGDWEELRAWQQAIDPAYMFLLATSSSAATGWTNQTTYDGASARFLRGGATYGGTGGAATHTPTVTGATVATTADGLDTATCSSLCSSKASYGHTHTTTAPTAGAANNDPAYHSFYLWKSNAQNPTTIPQNTFMFSTTSQSGSWTQFSAANDRLVKLTNSHTTGGSDTHTHAMTSWGSLAASSGTILVEPVPIDTPPSLAAASHTHTAPGNSTSDSKTSVPPYVTTLIYQQTNATPQTIPQNMVGMFDADPGTGWDVVSDASPYLNNMVRGHATTAESTGGAATHDDTASTTSPANATTVGNFSIGTDGAADNHTHTVTATITAGSDHTPPYVNFVLAKCTNASGCSGSSTYSVSGNVYSDEGSTLISGTPTIRLLVNGSNTACGGGACTASVSSGSYTISNITTTSGDVLLLYLDTAGSPLATTVTVGSGANLTGINLYQNRLIVRHETGTSITNANLGTGKGSYSDTDILYTYSGSSLTVANNTELHIWTGKTYDPNGTVTTQGTGDLHVDDSATAYLDTATSTINNNIAVDTGATLNVQATTTVNGAAAGGVTTAGTLNHTAGTFTIGNGTDEDLTVTAGTTTLSGGNTVIADDINNCSAGTLNINAGSNVDALGTTGILNMGNGCSASAILNLNGGSLDVGQHMYLDAGTVNLNGGTHRAGVTVDGIVEFARYANGGMTLNMTGGELIGRAIIIYNGETLTTTTVTGGTLTVDDLYDTVSSATWYQWSDDSPKFYNLQFNDTANDFNSSNLLTYLNGSLINNSAALTTNSKNITVEGNFTNNGSITMGTSTVTLAGTSQQTVTGATTFSTLTITNNSGSDAQSSPSVIFADGYNYSVGTLNVTTGNAKLRFPQGPTYSFAVTGTLNLNSSDANKIYLRSNASGTQWRFNVSGSPVVYDVDVKDSNAIGSTIDATDATNVNSTNNTNWNFGSTISISGTANGNDAATVMVAINGTPQAQTGTIGSGAWTISGVTTPTAGQTITVWVDNVTDANESTGITKWASGNVTGMVLNTNVVTIGSNQNQTLTVAEATQYTGASDEDIMHQLNSTTLTTDLFNAYTADQLSILASNGLTIDSTQTLDTYDLNNAGTLTSTTTASYYIRGSWTNSGTFTCGTSTVTFASQTTGKTINTGGVGATKDFYNVTFDGSGGAWSALTNTMTVTGNLTMTAGTLNNATGTASIQVNGNVQCGGTCGTITLNSGTFTQSVSGSKNFGTNVAVATNWTFYNLAFVNASGSNSITLNGTGTGQIIVSNNLSMTNSGTVLVVDNNTNDRIFDIANDVSIGAGVSFEASDSASFTVGGSWTNAGTFAHNSGTVTFDAGTIGKTITDGGSDWGNVTFNNAAGGWSFADSTTLAGDLTMTAGTLSGTNDITVNGGDAAGNGTINLTGGTFTLVGDGNFSGNTGWTFYNLTFDIGALCNGSDYTTNAGGTGQVTITNTFNQESCYCGEACSSDHYLNAAYGGVAKTWELSGTGTPVSNLILKNYDTENSTFKYTGSGSVTVSSDTYHNLELAAPTAQTYTYNGGNIYGNLTINSNTTLNAGSGVVYMKGTGTIDANDESFYDFYVDGTNNTVTVQNTGLTISRAISIGTGDTLTIGSNLTVSHTGVVFAVSGTINGAGTLRFTNTSAGPGTGGTVNSIVRYDSTDGNIANTTFDARTYGGAVEVYSNSASARTVTMGAGTHAISGNLSVITGNSQSGTFSLDNSSTNPTINLTGDVAATKGGSGTIGITTGTDTWAVAGNVNFTDIGLTATAGHTLQMNGSGKSITSAGQTLQNFAVTGGSVSSADALDVNGTWSLTSGSFTQSATSDMNIAGDFTMEDGTTFNKSATSGVIVLDGDLIFNDKNATKQNMGDVETGTSLNTINLASDVAANKLTVRPTDIFNTNGYDLDIGNKGVEISGTFDATDDVETDTTTINTTGDFIINSGATFTQSDSKVIFDGTSGTVNLVTDGTFSLYDLEINDGNNSLTVEVEDPLTVQNNLTITSGVLDTVAAESNNINVGGNWTNGDTFIANYATVTFDGTATGKTINPGSSSFYNVTFNGIGGAWSPLTNTVTITNDLIMTAGTFNTSNGTANVTVNGNVQCLTTCGTINMTSTNTFNQSVAADKAFGTNISGTTAWTFYNLTFTGTSGARTITTNGTGTGSINVINNLSLTNTGTTLVLDNNTNDRILDVGNNVSIAANTTLSSSSSATFTVGGSWSNSGTFTHNNGTVTFDASSGTKTINPGSSSFYILTFNNAGGTWQPTSNTLILDKNLNVTAGTMDNETNDQILDVAGDVSIGASGVLKASSTASFTVAGSWTNAGTFIANSGLVKFDAPSGTKNINSTGATTASFNNLTLDDNAGSAVFQLGSVLDVNGNLLITGGTLNTTSGSNWGITIGGNWTNNDTFIANSGQVTADGAAQQTFSGTTSGSAGKFYDLTITNNSGSDPDTSPSVIFSSNLETANTFRANTANTKLRFNAGSTYTLQNINFNGQAQHTRLYLRSSSGGSAWNLNVTGTRYVRNTDTKDSYACGQAPDIDATHISNKNSNGNSCWNFTALTFTISTDNLNLGTLTTGSVTTASHTVRTITSADNGYVTYVYVDGDLLNGNNTIDAATGTLSAGTEGYGIATSDAGQTITQDTGCDSAPYNVTAMTTSQQAVAGANSGPVDETSTICFQAAISSNTVAGNYSQTVTYVTVGLF